MLCRSRLGVCAAVQVLAPVLVCGCGEVLMLGGEVATWDLGKNFGCRLRKCQASSTARAIQRPGRQSTSLVHGCLTWESRFSPLPMIVLSCSAAISACSAIHAATSRRRPVFAFYLMFQATHDFARCPSLPSHWVGHEQDPVRLGRRVRINFSRPVLLRLVVQSPVTSQPGIVTLLEQPCSP